MSVRVVLLERADPLLVHLRYGGGVGGGTRRLAGRFELTRPSRGLTAGKDHQQSGT